MQVCLVAHPPARGARRDGADSDEQQARDRRGEQARIAATLAAIEVGEPMVVHVYPSSGALLVERLLVRSAAIASSS